MKNTDLKRLQSALVDFANDRDWNQFHSPKNLVMALSGEAGELAEVFQWLTEEESQNLTGKQQERAEEEIADVFLYLLRLSDKLGIDLIEAASEKLKVNEEKYPVDRSYGTAKKYTEL